jgi:hypothetical protein
MMKSSYIDKVRIKGAWYSGRPGSAEEPPWSLWRTLMQAGGEAGGWIWGSTELWDAYELTLILKVFLFMMLK